jgi:oligopeptide/dipeptide ABC transporter ATP-binding protein
MNATGREPLISAVNLRKRFNLEAGFFARLGRFVHAVNGVSLEIGGNEAYGLVGESGCGKTTAARLLVRMYEADEGEILFRGRGGTRDVRKLKGRDFKRYRETVKYVFQDPARSLNPRMTVYEVLTSGARWSSRGSGASGTSLREEAAAILEETGLSAADLERRPAEFSGGQRQRISIARGLMMKPELLICDEVVSALDVSVQGQILNLLLDLRSRREISFLFIAHDLKVACYFCDRIGVMYRGEIMEEAPAAELWKDGLHPYTELLFSSVGSAGERRPSETPLSGGEVRSVVSETGLAADSGCAFAARCPYAEGRCFRERPELKAAGAAGHLARCWLRP